MGFLTDIREEFKKLDLAKKSLRKFGITMAIALSAIGALIFVKSGSIYALWLGGFAAFFAFTGLTFPNILRPFFQIWMGLAFVLGWFVSRILLSSLYYLIVTPISLLVKLKMGDILEQKLDKHATSYWNKRENQATEKEQYERLF